jgi:acetyl-CoA synthetase
MTQQTLNTIDSILTENRRFKASPTFRMQANIQNEAYYHAAAKNRLQFWNDRAQELSWFTPWKTTLDWDRPYAKWFKEGTLNASYNCLDIHLTTHRRDKPALIWEGEDGTRTQVTYYELWQSVTIAARVLKEQLNVKQGDRVTLYMPMTVDAVVMMLACARIGAIHSVVFGGFSAQALYDRIVDSGSTIVITAFGGYRRGKVLNLKATVDKALSLGKSSVESVLCTSYLKAAASFEWNTDRDYLYDDLKHGVEPGLAAEKMESEATLFILYTSGTTGKPKGIIHSTGGYMTHAKYSTSVVFDLKDSDVFWCTADIGWITGHTYLVYGPLANGATVFMAEGAPDYPTKSRFWSLIDQYKISIFYTAPTAIRSFMKWGDSFIKPHNLSSLRLLGSVGEPINPEAWMWYYTAIGQENCPIVDTWWQTETGGIMVSNISSINDMKPGSAGLALPGIEVDVLNTEGNPVKTGGGLLSITSPWPSMLRGIWGDPKRLESVYWEKFSTYFAGDSAIKDTDGYFKVLGRVDDVLNCAGHRIGTMEVESALVDHHSVAEAAVVGIADDIKGQAILAFVILKEDVNEIEEETDTLTAEITHHVDIQIGAIARPKYVIITSELPKTRSGKIMRRVLKAIVNNEDVGDTSTLANPEIVAEIKEKIKLIK